MPRLSLLEQAQRLVIIKGGPTSGNFGHKGRKGKRGGSKGGDGHSALGLKRDASKQERRKKVAAHRKAAKRVAGQGELQLPGEIQQIFMDLEQEAKRQGGGKTSPVTPPGGKAMSEALDMSKVPKKGKIGPPIRDTLAAIDSVHGDGALDSEVPMKVGGGRLSNGGYSYFPSRSDSVTISRNGRTPMLTTAHEMGHMLDHRGLRGRKLSRHGSEAGKDASPEMRELLRTMEESRGVKGLRGTRGKTVEVEIKRRGSDGKPTGESFKHTYRADNKHIDYMTSPSEVFARGYAQYIAVKSKNPRMLKELEDTMSRKGVGKFDYRGQWDADDFKPIEQAFDNLLRAEGYIG